MPPVRITAVRASASRPISTLALAISKRVADGEEVRPATPKYAISSEHEQARAALVRVSAARAARPRMQRSAAAPPCERGASAATASRITSPWSARSQCASRSQERQGAGRSRPGARPRAACPRACRGRPRSRCPHDHRRDHLHLQPDARVRLHVDELDRGEERGEAGEGAHHHERRRRPRAAGRIPTRRAASGSEPVA